VFVAFADDFIRTAMAFRAGNLVTLTLARRSR